ncbi:MAG: tetratricopeptide repeat protein [Pseudomonadota bacterium]
MDPEGSRRFLSRVEALLDARMFDLAQELAAERLGRLPEDVDARIAMCKVWTRMGKLERVEEILRDVEKRISDWSRLHAAMGDICRESGLQKEAVRFYRRFLALNPQGVPYETIAEKLDRLLMDAGVDALLPDEDQDHYEHINDIAPDFHTMTLAELYLRQNQPDMARHVLNEILRREPDHREAAARLREIENRRPALQDNVGGQPRERVIRELSRWLNNIGRIGGYAT